MKVTLPKDYRKRFTLEQMDIARRISRDMKDDTSTPAEYIVYAVNDWLRAAHKHDYCEEVLKATAQFEGNCRIYEAYGEGTDCMDIWIDATVRTGAGFLVIGAYLTDIWEISSETSHADHYYARYYTEDKA